MRLTASWPSAIERKAARAPGLVVEWEQRKQNDELLVFGEQLLKRRANPMLLEHHKLEPVPGTST